jgi:hypothetical protein
VVADLDRGYKGREEEDERDVERSVGRHGVDDLNR